MNRSNLCTGQFINGVIVTFTYLFDYPYFHDNKFFNKAGKQKALIIKSTNFKKTIPWRKNLMYV